MNALPAIFNLLVYTYFDIAITEYFIFFSALNVFYAATGNFMAYTYVSYQWKAKNMQTIEDRIYTVQLIFALIVTLVFSVYILITHEVIYLIGILDLFVMLQVNYRAKLKRLNDDYKKFVLTIVGYNFLKVFGIVTILIVGAPDKILIYLLGVNALLISIYFVSKISFKKFQFIILKDLIKFNKYIVLNAMLIAILISGDRLIFLSAGLEGIALNLGYIALFGQLLQLVYGSVLQKIEGETISRAKDYQYTMLIFRKFVSYSLPSMIILAFPVFHISQIIFPFFEVSFWFYLLYGINVICISSLSYLFSVLLGLGRVKILSFVSVTNSVLVFLCVYLSAHMGMGLFYILPSIALNIITIALVVLNLNKLRGSCA